MIEPVNKDNLEEVLPLIRLYQTFYQVANISDERNREFFSQFGEDNAFGCQFLYRSQGEAVGFATVYLTYNTNITSKIAVLNDLYTLESSRGQGVGRQLIDHALAFAKERGAARLQWITATDNKTAQRLYDSMDTTRTEWVHYFYYEKDED